MPKSLVYENIVFSIRYSQVSVKNVCEYLKFRKISKQLLKKNRNYIEISNIF
jgi:hypothetical protein